jgi:hypothetical protein
MKTFWNRVGIRNFGIVVIAIGAVLLLVSLIRGSTMLIAFLKGVPLTTLREINVNVLNVFFDFVIPFIGGLFLLLSGGMLLRIEEGRMKTSVETEKKQAVNTERERHIGTVLNQNEKAILGMIRASGNGGVLQSDIVVKTGYSKVKIHRIVKKLENMELIDRGRFGITNKIFAKSPL